MNKRVFGFFLVVIGFVLIAGTSPVITGNVVLDDIQGLKAYRILGILFFISGVLLMAFERRKGGLEKELDKPLPGKGIKGEYIPLSEILDKKHLFTNKVKIDMDDNHLYRDGRIVQGLKIDGDFVEFKGYHFTNKDSAKIIQDDEALEIKNIEDPYVYLLEPMNYGGKNENQIKHMIGSSSASEALIVNIRYPVDKIYMKFEKGRPTHFAVDGDVERSDLLMKKGIKVIRKRLEDL